MVCVSSPLHFSRGIWLSMDLMLAFLILQAAVFSTFAPLLLEHAYAQARGANAQQASDVLIVSSRLYTSSTLSASTAWPPLRWAGYFDSSIPPASIGLSPDYGARFEHNLGIPPSSSSPQRICFSRPVLSAG